MKTFLLINRIFWAVIALIISIAVAVEWTRQGCPFQSVVMAWCFYIPACAALCFTIDQTVQGK